MRNGSLETQGHPHVTPRQSPQNSPQTSALGVEPPSGFSPSFGRAEPFDMFAGQKLTAEQSQQVRAPPSFCSTPSPLVSLAPFGHAQCRASQPQAG